MRKEPGEWGADNLLIAAMGVQEQETKQEGWKQGKLVKELSA